MSTFRIHTTSTFIVDLPERTAANRRGHEDAEQLEFFGRLSTRSPVALVPRWVTESHEVIIHHRLLSGSGGCRLRLGELTTLDDLCAFVCDLTTTPPIPRRGQLQPGVCQARRRA
jgi:hypothetical protein